MAKTLAGGDDDATTKLRSCLTRRWTNSSSSRSAGGTSQRWALGELLEAFERGTVGRLLAAEILDSMEKGELRDPISEGLRLEVRDEALAMLAPIGRA